MAGKYDAVQARWNGKGFMLKRLRLTGLCSLMLMETVAHMTVFAGEWRTGGSAE